MIGAMVAAAALAVSGHVAGRLLTGRMDFHDALERAVVATLVGLAALAHLALAAALAGALRPAPVLFALVVLHAAGWAVWRVLWREARPIAARLRRAWDEHPALLILAAAALAAGALPFLLLPLYPPTAFDALLYHLPYVRAFVSTGAAPFLPDLRYPIFPQLNEMLMSLVYMFGGELGAQLTMSLATLLSAAVTYVWGRSAFPESRLVAAGAAAAFLGNPIIVGLAGTAYVEPGLVLWTTASLYAVHRFRRGGGRSWIVLAALFGSCGAGCKYLGLFFVVVAGLAVLAGGWPRRPPRRRLADGLLFAVVACLVLAPWYGRILAATRNPVFPFFTDLFGDSPWRPVFFAPGLWGVAAHRLGAPGSLGGSGTAGGVAGRALGEALRWLWALLRLPWDLLTGWERTGLAVPPSPYYLLAAPLLLLGAWREPRIRRPLVLVALYAALLLALPADVRYLTPVLPLASLGLAGALAHAIRDLADGRHRRRIREPRAQGASAPSARVQAAIAAPQARRGDAWGAWTLAAFLLLPGWAYGLNRVVRQGPIPRGPAERDSYLTRALPIYPALSKLNRTLGSHYTVYAFFAENMAYYAEGRFLGDWIGPASFLRLPPPSGDPEALYFALRRLGADHLLVPNSPEVTLTTATPAFRRRFLPFYRDAAARVFSLVPAATATPGSS